MYLSLFKPTDEQKVLVKLTDEQKDMKHKFRFCRWVQNEHHHMILEAKFANRRSEAISPYPHSTHNPLSLSFFFLSHITLLLSIPLIIHQPTNSTKTQFLQPPSMAAMNSSVLACNYAISGSASSSSELNSKLIASPAVSGVKKMPVIRAQQVKVSESSSKASEGRRAAMIYLAATLFTTAAASANSSANAGIIDEYLERSKANKVLLNTHLYVHAYTYNPCHIL